MLEPLHIEEESLEVEGEGRGTMSSEAFCWCSGGTREMVGRGGEAALSGGVGRLCMGPLEEGDWERW